jgi:hypothetical protein
MLSHRASNSRVVGSRTTAGRSSNDTYRQWASCKTKTELLDLRKDMSRSTNTAKYGGSSRVPTEFHHHHPITNVGVENNPENYQPGSSYRHSARYSQHTSNSYRRPSSRAAGVPARPGVYSSPRLELRTSVGPDGKACIGQPPTQDSVTARDAHAKVRQRSWQRPPSTFRGTDRSTARSMSSRTDWNESNPVSRTELLDRRKDKARRANESNQDFVRPTTRYHRTRPISNVEVCNGYYS